MAYKSESITEEIFILHYHGEKFEKLFKKENKGSSNETVKKLLSTASKRGTGNLGYPEFILTDLLSPENVIVIECKKDKKFHKCEDEKHVKAITDYAVDGAIHYGAALSANFNVIAIGISGTNPTDLLVSHYYFKKGDAEPKELEGYSQLRSPEDYSQVFRQDEEIIAKHEEELAIFARDLHKKLHADAKLGEKEKPLFVSAVLIALQSSMFRSGYKGAESGLELAENLYSSVENVFAGIQITEDKRRAIMQPYGFLKTRTEFTAAVNGAGEVNTLLKDLIYLIHENVIPHIKTMPSFDILGNFYGEFLRYTGGDKQGLGIVLTPRHITNLMAELAGVNKNSTVLDICGGTLGFLIAAKILMIADAAGDVEKINEIKTKQLIGVEQQPEMYALATANLFLRGVNSNNFYLGNCFTLEEEIKKHKPNTGIINPPYALEGYEERELKFVKYMMDQLEENGTGVAIVPIACAVGSDSLIVQERQALLENHTLEAVISLPDETFNDVGIVACIMVFTAKKKHPEDYETWFGYWKNDGFEKVKHLGRVDRRGVWPDIKKKWLSDFRNRRAIPGQSVKKVVTAGDEWCAEAYMETDYSTMLKKEDFIEQMRKFSIFKALSVDEGVEEGE
ncbi:SAM-dependent methyltransferase [Bacillus cereus]|uniref:HsdM family class I SAM-dependent methyltransferase n=1 Tax=Bacillus cereus TaxID=1396 RepID=UPI002226C8B5|nr:SAM-dependent methyltransferase [Bacillus cereus]UYY93994.1 SAM-dependent methyltransferase [Bacillus cereus]